MGTRGSQVADVAIDFQSFRELQVSAGKEKVAHLQLRRSSQDHESSSAPHPCRNGTPVYPEVYLEKDEPVPVQPNFEDLLRAETDDDAEEALSLAD
jgi:hypothetical protein